MTAFDGFDLVDARVAGAIDEIAAASRPDYLDDVFQVTARTRQRAALGLLRKVAPHGHRRSLAAHGLPARRHAAAGHLPGRSSCWPSRPSPSSRSGHGTARRRRSGPAANGSLVYGYGGDLYVRDTLESRAAPPDRRAG